MPTHAHIHVLISRPLRTLLCTLCVLCPALLSAGCARRDTAHNANGHLLVIGGGLERDNAPVYQRILELAKAASPEDKARVVIATAASADEAASEKSARAAFALYDTKAVIACITRDTPSDETVLILSRANAIFFTGGDQKRITARYRPDPAAAPSPELLAFRELLNRGGVIAGTSAGAAMMSEIMFLGGRSIDALGYPRQSANAAGRSNQTDDPDNPASPDEAPPAKGPNIGPGMGFIRTLITDSHFIERNRVGRLVAALEASNLRLGLGVAENACVHINLRTGEIVGISAAASQLIDIGAMHREGPARRNALAFTLNKDTRVNINDVLRSPAASQPQREPTQAQPIDITAAVPDAPESNRAERRLLSLRLFERAASASPRTAFKLVLDGWQITARQADRADTNKHTWIAFDLEPTAATPSTVSDAPKPTPTNAR
ncbi:MAG: cyanophycinase [Phycisphaerales bacterium]|nr:cyanophycinase [Phycisphaerales bacterium]